MTTLRLIYYLGLFMQAGEKKELFGGATLLHLGGHFPSSTALHWDKGANGKGILCASVSLSHFHASVTSFASLLCCPRW